MTEQDNTKEILGMATYSPEDNKLRFYPFEWLDSSIWEEFKRLGFRSAPKQKKEFAGCFVGPMWTPAREDLCLKYAESIEDEDTSLVERAEMRSERFDGYSTNAEKRGKEAMKTADQISERFEFGQPILVGHHSERKARKDKERIQNQMSRAVSEFDRAEYWERRAEGAIHHAKYKQKPDVIARRIKGLEADLRKHNKEMDSDERLAYWFLEVWDKWAKEPGKLEEHGYHDIWTQDPPPTSIEKRILAGHILLYENGVKEVDEEHREFYEDVLKVKARVENWHNRWVFHLEQRLKYERAIYAANGKAGGDKVIEQTGKPLEVGGAVFSRDFPLKGKWAQIIRVNKSNGQIASVSTEPVHGSWRHREIVPFISIHDIATKDEWSREDFREAAYNNRLEYLTKEREEQAQATKLREEKKENSLRDVAEDALKEIEQTEIQVHYGDSFYPTPQWLAYRMVGLTELFGGDCVLEPSAGSGALVEEIIAKIEPYISHIQPIKITMVEVYPKARQILLDKFAAFNDSQSEPWIALADEGDFMAFDPPDNEWSPGGKFSTVIMNPPFSNRQDVKHVKRAYDLLEDGGRLVAVVSSGSVGSEYSPTPFREWVEERGWIERVESGAFKNVGTMTNTCLIIVNK